MSACASTIVRRWIVLVPSLSERTWSIKKERSCGGNVSPIKTSQAMVLQFKFLKREMIWDQNRFDSDDEEDVPLQATEGATAS